MYRFVMCHRRLCASVTSKLLRIGEQNEQREIAYRDTPGHKSPGLIFLPGYMSNMKGIKATSIEEFCSKNGHPFIRFDYEGTGESPGEFTQQTLSRWKENIVAILNLLTTGPQILVGSSMGGWLMCLVAMELPERIHGLIGICPAINFVVDLQRKCDENLIQKEADGGIRLPGPYGNYLFSKNLLEDSTKHLIDIKSPIAIKCPVRLIHGIKDDTVPYETSIKLMQNLQTKDVELVLRKDGDHRMSEPRDVEILIKTIQSILV